MLAAGGSDRVVGMAAGNDNSPSFTGNQQPGCNVPAGDPPDPETVEPTSCKVGEINCRRARSSYGMDPGNDGKKISDGLRLCRNVGRKAHGNEGIG